MSDLKIKIEDLKQGDILLFSHTEEWESKLISLITDSPVSHAAISYYSCKEIAEETPPCAIVNLIEERKTGREITVMRLNSSEKDMTKVLDIAKKYVEDEEPYTKANLVFILVYILFKKLTVNLKLQKLLCTLMKYVISGLIKYIDNKLREGSHPMVCSQFVYNCYKNAGEEYNLIISEFDSGKSILAQVKEYINNNKIALENKMVNDIERIKAEYNEISSVEEEDLIRNIYNELKIQLESGIEKNNSQLYEEFVIAVHEFTSVLNYLYNQDKTKKLVIKNKEELQSKGIDSLSDIEEYFVTPGDLLYNCRNLINIGILED